MRWKLFLPMGILIPLLISCGGAAPGPTPTPTLEELPPPVTPLVPFELSPAVAVPTGESPPTVYLDPPTVSLTVGETAAVRVWASGFGEITSLSLEILLEPGTVVRVEDALPDEEGVQVALGDLFSIPFVNEVADNRVALQAAREPGANLPTSGVVATLTLRAIAPGMASVQMIHIGAQKADGSPVDVAPPAAGLITVSEAGAAGIPLPATPTTAPLLTPPPPPTVVVPPTPVPGGRGIYYIVQRGENLFRIGLRFGTTADAIAAASGLPDPGQVRAGTMVLIPVSSGCAAYGYYVQPGDTLYSIARRFGMTVEELAALNGIGPDYQIRVGQILCVVRR